LYLLEELTDTNEVLELDIEKDDFCELCALEGHLLLLKWGRENGCDWDTFTCSNAAKRGHFELLKWAREQGILFLPLPLARFSCSSS
jgi:hypothetical protein